MNLRNKISIYEPSLFGNEVEYVNDALKSNWISSKGDYINKFERKFAKFCGSKYALTTSNGTVAIHLALEALGIGEEDEVIVPDLTFISTANAVTYTNAKPVFVDVSYDSLCIDPHEIEKSINVNTKAIIVVHLYGNPADMKSISKIAKRHNLYIIEDAAEAHGAMIGNKKVGSFGDISTFSFYGNKVITTGEGGMIVTNNKSCFNKMKILRDHGMSITKKFWHDQIGYNYRLTNLQAAIGLGQLENIEKILNRKKEIFELYKNGLSVLDNIKFNSKVEGETNVYWLVFIRLLKENTCKRDDLISFLEKNNIESRPFFYPISDMPMYGNAKTLISHKTSDEGICLPSHYNLKDEEIYYVIKMIIKFFN